MFYIYLNLLDIWFYSNKTECFQLCFLLCGTKVGTKWLKLGSLIVFYINCNSVHMVNLKRSNQKTVWWNTGEHTGLWKLRSQFLTHPLQDFEYMSEMNYEVRALAQVHDFTILKLIMRTTENRDSEKTVTPLLFFSQNITCNLYINVLYYMYICVFLAGMYVHHVYAQCLQMSGRGINSLGC